MSALINDGSTTEYGIIMILNCVTTKLSRQNIKFHTFCGDNTQSMSVEVNYTRYTIRYMTIALFDRYITTKYVDWCYTDVLW